MASAAAKAKPQVDIIKLKNVRLSFPSLFENETYKGDDTGKKSATFLIPKGSKMVAAVEDAIDTAIMNGNWKGKAPAANKVVTTMRDGDQETYDGYAGMMALKATTTRNPVLVDEARAPILPDQADTLMYPGMFVNVSLDFSAGTDSYGNHRVWCNLRGVQRFRDGDRFSSGTPVDIDSEFDDFSDDDEDDLLD